MSYPKIKDDDFNKRINQKFGRYTIPKKRKTFRQICFPKQYQLQIPQKFCSKYINPKSPYKGVLIFHQIGAGKTCTAIQIGEAWKHKYKIIVVVPASLKGNFRGELRSQCAKNSYLKAHERSKLDTLPPTSDEYKDIIHKSDKRINKCYEIYSYNKFINAIEDNTLVLSRRVLIIDEIQNMISEHGKYYKMLYEAVSNSPSSLRIILLSATPMFDKPVEIALTMNILKIPIELPIGREFDKMFIKTRQYKDGKKTYSTKNLDIFKDYVKGYVSYFRGAPPYVFPEKAITYVKCTMSSFQYRSYLTVMTKEDINSGESILKKVKQKLFKEGDIMQLPNNFFIGTRIISNIAFPNKNINEEGFESFVGKCLESKNLKKYSIKFYRMINKIKKCKGPCFIYSNFKEYGGIKSLTAVMDAHGYKDYNRYGPGRKRYAVWSGDESTEIKDEIRDVYNQKVNNNGSQIKVLLGSPSIKEGVSLLRVRQIHILEPYWNQSRMDQVIGRGIRFCSHKDLEKEDRFVKVYVYIAVHPAVRETIDEYIQKLAFRKNRIIKHFEKALKESAIDCKMNYSANNHKGEEKLQCEE
jgi:superfamily II DNA or RNA helicase